MTQVSFDMLNIHVCVLCMLAFETVGGGCKGDHIWLGLCQYYVYVRRRFQTTLILTSGASLGGCLLRAMSGFQGSAASMDGLIFAPLWKFSVWQSQTRDPYQRSVFRLPLAQDL